MPTPPTPPSNSNGGSTTTPNKKKPPSRLWSSGSSPKNSPQSSPKTSPQNSKSKLVGKSTKSNNRSSDRDLTNMDASTNSNFSRSTSNSTSLGGTNTNTNDEPVVKAKRSSMGHGSKFTQGVTKMVQAPFKAGMYAGQKVVEAGTRTSTAVVQAGTAVGTTVGNTVTKGGKAMVDAGTAVGTTVGNTVIFGANTIVGGGKAIVEGTGAVVEYSGKTVVKGVKGLVTVPLSLAKRGTKAKSKWDQGVDTIDSLLEPSSDTYQAMTPEQRKALQNVKKLLLRGPSEQDKIAHIPRDLLKEGNKEMKEIRRRNTTSTGGAKTIANRRASTNFILQEYAGVRSAAIAADDLTESEGDGSDALDSSENSEPIIGENEDLDSMRRPSIQISLSVDDMDIYHTPSEFKALSLEDQKKMCTLLAWENLARWDFNIFELDLLSQGNPLLYMGWAILGAPHAQMAMAGECEMTSPPDDAGFNFLTEFSIPPRKLCNYLRIIQKDYHAENPYHNAIHAADVVQSLNALLHMILGQGSLSYCPPIMIFSILLSAVVHDVGK